MYNSNKNIAQEAGFSHMQRKNEYIDTVADRLATIEDPKRLEKNISDFANDEGFNKLPDNQMKALAFTFMWKIKENNDRKIKERK